MTLLIISLLSSSCGLESCSGLESRVSIRYAYAVMVTPLVLMSVAMSLIRYPYSWRWDIVPFDIQDWTRWPCRRGWKHKRPVKGRFCFQRA